MNTSNDALPICSVCGQAISAHPPSEGDRASRDHVPPKQFYPKGTRTNQNVNLWVVPTHRHCNEDYRKDEEYFYHAIFPLVREANRAMGQTIHRDLMRRANNPQTPAMARNLLKTFKPVTDGGIYLPPGVVQFHLDPYRVERVAIKIAQGLFYRDKRRHVPAHNCKDIRLCLTEDEAPEIYRLSWQGAQAQSALPHVFSYRRFEFENLHLFSMLFWEAFMFCAAFENPSSVTVPAA